MKPPPPIPHDAGFVTPTANAVATAASTALPPCFRISTPACAASSLSETTIPCVPTADRLADESAAERFAGMSAQIAADRKKSAENRKIATVARVYMSLEWNAELESIRILLTVDRVGRK